MWNWEKTVQHYKQKGSWGLIIFLIIILFNPYTILIYSGGDSPNPWVPLIWVWLLLNVIAIIGLIFRRIWALYLVMILFVPLIFLALWGIVQSISAGYLQGAFEILLNK